MSQNELTLNHVLTHGKYRQYTIRHVIDNDHVHIQILLDACLLELNYQAILYLTNSQKRIEYDIE